VGVNTGQYAWLSSKCGDSEPLLYSTQFDSKCSSWSEATNYTVTAPNTCEFKDGGPYDYYMTGACGGQVQSPSATPAAPSISPSQPAGSAPNAAPTAAPAVNTPSKKNTAVAIGMDSFLAVFELVVSAGAVLLN
jgi:hypothetical protein